MFSLGCHSLARHQASHFPPFLPPPITRPAKKLILSSPMKLSLRELALQDLMVLHASLATEFLVIHLWACLLLISHTPMHDCVIHGSRNTCAIPLRFILARACQHSGRRGSASSLKFAVAILPNKLKRSGLIYRWDLRCHCQRAWLRATNLT